MTDRQFETHWGRIKPKYQYLPEEDECFEKAEWKRGIISKENKAMTMALDEYFQHLFNEKNKKPVLATVLNIYQRENRPQINEDYKIRLKREHEAWRKEFDELYKDVKIPDHIKTVQDHINYIKTKLATMGMAKAAKKNKKNISPKKQCLNCGSFSLVRQYDPVAAKKSNVVWTNKYECLRCKEVYEYPENGMMA